MKNELQDWLQEKAAQEDGCFVSAGGLITDIEELEQRLATQSETSYLDHFAGGPR